MFDLHVVVLYCLTITLFHYLKFFNLFQVYNLRNRKSRQSCSCYLRNDLNLNCINPKVRLERHKILDSRSGKCSFIVEGSKILHKVDKQKSCNKIKVFVFLCVILVLLTFISMEGQ